MIKCVFEWIKWEKLHHLRKTFLKGIIFRAKSFQLMHQIGLRKEKKNWLNLLVIIIILWQNHARWVSFVLNYNYLVKFTRKNCQFLSRTKKCWRVPRTLAKNEEKDTFISCGFTISRWSCSSSLKERKLFRKNKRWRCSVLGCDYGVHERGSNWVGGKRCTG